MGKTEINVPAGIPQIEVTREFDAPSDLVFRAFVEPDLVARWLGPRYLVMTVDRWEAVDGGRYRYVHADPAGTVHGFRGVFHGTPEPAGIVRTFEYESTPGHVALETTTLEARGDRTFVRTLSTFQSVADRDAMVVSGMEPGVHDSNERLAELLAELQAG